MSLIKDKDKFFREYYESGCLCLLTGKLEKYNGSDNEEAVDYYNDNCNCSRNINSANRNCWDRDIIIKIEETDPCSRSLASRYRNAIVDLINEGKKGTIDLTNVISMSHSFADELFGVIILDYGWDKMWEHIQLKGADDSVRSNIKNAIFGRMDIDD